MEQSFIKPFANRTLLVFVIGFILTLPFPYHFLPHIGEILLPILESFKGNFIQNTDAVFQPDSWMMVSTTFVLFLLSISIASILMLTRKGGADRVHFWLYRISAYYLSLTLLIYGCNKVFKYQFYFPEPNTLFTPLGQLNPDILYWSSMGTSYSYSVFAGLIEILPAFLLLFRKTRLLGALIALGVLINVLMINIGFDIEVKIFTSFLILLSLILLQPHFKRFYSFFINNAPVSPFEESAEPKSKYYIKPRPYLKIILISIILFESFGPYCIKGQFNGDTEAKIYMHGAYAVSDNPLKIERIFIHNKGYFILQDKDDSFTDYEMSWNQDILTLNDYEGQTCQLNLVRHKDGTFRLTGFLFKTYVVWDFERIHLESLAIFEGQ
ncbi:MAG: hypothetical protein GQ574_08950 [Crocinitomix sp.]|nr:hypothetical protein [Crocinitomix sp.]